MLVRQCYVRNLDCLGFIVCSGRVVCSSVSSLKIVVPSKKVLIGHTVEEKNPSQNMAKEFIKADGLCE